ncbi:hypothetical protein [Thermostichus vulcanus]|uniref:DUF2939 domain-containing protein n=1 Tax=Thermostichus vulcanus str. 'Rupite' TaxID=2813851 RepID=A0ABT0C8B4_THEVL|nr:hypothetical protein [Thermostichus vulcanus]MCJ2541949.1 hypothetical protein [Thermostichus vulcanus str. 'Rupite']
MLRRFPVWITVVALWGGIACTQAAPVQAPDEVVNTFIAATDKGDWGTADSYLTERFSNALRPGSLPSIWGLVGENPQIRNQEVTGNTAYVWVEGTSSLEDAGQRLGLDPLTLRSYLTEPDFADPNYQQLASQLVGMRLEGDTVISRVKITLYRQEAGWRIEVWQPDAPEGEASRPDTTPQLQLAPQGSELQNPGAADSSSTEAEEPSENP